MYDEKNKDCKLFGTEECALLNQNGCLDCYAAKLKADDQQKLLAGLKRLREAAPLEEVEPLYTADQCLLCKAPSAGTRTATHSAILQNLRRARIGPLR